MNKNMSISEYIEDLNRNYKDPKLLLQDISYEDRVQKALDIIWNYSQYDGEHHKAWAIDQVVRVLTGALYDKYIADYCQNGKYDWNVGIAP